MTIWACDPGINGAIVAIDGRRIISIYRMPKVPHPTSKIIKNKIDTRRLTYELSKFPKPSQAIIELPDPISNNSRLVVSSLFHSIGIIEGCISKYCDEISFIQPQRWQKKYNLIGKNKQESINVAGQIFKELTVKLVKDADISEAALIGHYFNAYMGNMD